MSFVSLLLAPLLLGRQHPQVYNPNRLVTFSAPATRLSNLLPQLSKAAGVNLGSNPQTGNEVVLIQVKDVPLHLLLDQIAKVTNAEWLRNRRTIRLIRRTRSIQKAQAEEAARLLQICTATLESTAQSQAKWTASAAPSYVFVSDGISRKLNNAGSKNLTVLTSLLRSIGPRTLTALEEDRRTVFTLHPTANQLPLPSGSEALIKDHPQATLVVTRKTSTVPVWQAMLTLRDAAGHAVDWCEELVYADFDHLVAAPGGFGLNASSKLPFTLSPTTQEFLTQSVRVPHTDVYADNPFTGSDRYKPKPHSMQQAPLPDFSLSTPAQVELRKQLINPETFEPMQLAAGEVLSKYAQSKSLNLVADLPDTAFNWLTLSRLLLKGGPPPQGFLTLCEQAGIKFDSSAGWLTASPLEPLREESNKVNREALGLFIRKNLGSATVRLNDLAQLALAQEKPVRAGDIDGGLIAILLPAVKQQATQLLAEPSILRIYATLTPDQIAKKKIPFSELTPLQMKWLADEVLNTPDDRYFDFGRKDPPGITSNASSLIERTQELPNGIDPNGTLTLETTEEPGALATATRDHPARFITPAQFAQKQYYAGSLTEKLSRDPISTGPEVKFQIATHKKITLTFQLTPTISYIRSFDDYIPAPNTEPVAYSKLPDWFNDLIAQELAQGQAHWSKPIK